MTHDANNTESKNRRLFLVILDETPEMEIALSYACMRARQTNGRVALLKIIEQGDTQHWQAVEDMMRIESREKAEAILRRMGQKVTKKLGRLPIFFIGHGKIRDETLSLLEKEPDISVLVLASPPNNDDTSALVTRFTGKILSQIKIPVTIVPNIKTP